jgi:hypothetical protein
MPGASASPMLAPMRTQRAESDGEQRQTNPVPRASGGTDVPPARGAFAVRSRTAAGMVAVPPHRLATLVAHMMRTAQAGRR